MLPPNETLPFREATDFLVSAQEGLDAGVLEAERVAVLRGYVKGDDGVALTGVHVSAPARPELGVVRTREGGLFDFLVNGGGEVVLNFEKEGYLSVQRRVNVPWNDYTWTEDVTLLPLDAAATPVAFGGSEGQLVSGSTVSDDAGVRRATVYIPAGTIAFMVMPSGEKRAMPQATFRATEYTVGERGPSAMPGALPPSVAYTYAVELSFDEARAAGAVNVEFDRPVALYVDEYLGFPVGSSVPAASYDRVAGVWQPSENGRVLKVLEVASGLASLDLDGDGAAESAAALLDAGITPEELQRVGATWTSGKKLTRTAMTHFSPWDCNNPWAPQEGAGPPEEPEPKAENQTKCDDTEAGSIISCSKQSLGEVLPLTGVPFSLVYSSEDAPGRRETLVIPVMGARSPKAYPLSAAVELSVGGRRSTYAGLSALPGTSIRFAWDGRDAYGRSTRGPMTVRGRTGYVYPLVYATGAAFGRLWGQVGWAGSSVTSNRNVILWQDWTATLDAHHQDSWDDLGGWRPSILQRQSAFAKTVTPTIDTIAGTGRPYSGDNGPASMATINPVGLALGAGGTFYVSDADSKTVRAVSPAGVVTAVAGGGVSTDELVRPLVARLSPGRLAVGVDGRLHVVDGQRVRRLRSDGLIETVAGMLNPGFAGDGRPASEAKLSNPQGIAVGQDGALYIADTGNHRIRKVDAAGVISTIAGGGACGFSGDGALASAAQLCGPTDVAVGTDGALYIADTGNFRIRRIDASGQMATVAGTGVAGFSGDGGPATAAQLSSPVGVNLVGGEALLVADGVRVRRLELSSGVITTIAGGGSGADGGPATGAALSVVTAVLSSPSGVYLTDSAGLKVRRVRPDGVLETVVGGQPAVNGEGGKARNAAVTAPTGVATGADGSIYVATDSAIMKLTRTGLWLRVAGVPGKSGDSGDLGPATAALLSAPVGVAVGRDGSLYIADSGNHRIRKVAPSGVISTIAGTGEAGFGGDGGPATSARLNGPKGVTVDGEGVLFIADTGNHRIRRLGLDGTVTTYAGTGVPGYSGDGAMAMKAALRAPSGVAVGLNGALYIADTGNHQVRRVEATGVISMVVGGSTQCVSSGNTPARQDWCLTYPMGVGMAPSGGVYVADTGNSRIVYLGTDGAVSTVAGEGAGFFAGDKGPATQASLRGPRAVAVGPDGLVAVADTGNNRVRAIASAVGVKSLDETMVASGDGSEVYVFGRTQQHLRTVSGLTGVLIWAFAYDSRGRLVSVTDGDGLKTTVERDAEGRPVAIVGPYGHRNVLAVDGTGYLKTVTNPLGETVTLTHTDLGLLTRMVDAMGGVHEFEYEVDGRLRVDKGPTGSIKELLRTDDSETKYTVTVRTAANRMTKYETTRDTEGGESKRVTAYDGTVSTRTSSEDGKTESVKANGMRTWTLPGGDARYGTMAPTLASLRVQTPSGLTWQGGESSQVSWVNGSEAFGLETLTKTSTVNGRQWETTYSAADRTWTWRTPMGRTGRVVLDEKERPVRSEAPGVEAAVYSYDAAGRLESITQGARKVKWAYDGEGNVASMTDPLGRLTGYGYNGALRLTGVRLPGVGLLELETDASGNVTRVTTPGGKRHGYGYDLANQETSYSAPELAGVKAQTYQYSPDLLMTSATHPDGTQSVLRRDEAGRVVGVSAPWGETGHWYTAGTGQLAAVTRNGQQLEYRYDGALLTSDAASGVVSGVVNRVFDSFFRVASLAVNGSAVSYGYDEDGLLVSAGPVVLTRSAATGQVLSAQVGKTRTTYGYDGYGALKSLETSAASVPVFREDVTLDVGGNIAGKSVTVRGVGNRWEYGYDEALRLTTATRDGVVSGTWTYDAEGNRLTADGATASFDARGGLLAQGATTYGYDAFGNRTRKVAGEATTEYRYAGAGALTGVTLPDGALVEYIIDARGRRVAKKKDGVFHAGWLYDGQLRIVGEVNSTGTLTSRFVYGTVGHSPDVMVRGGVTYRYVHDSLGSVRLVVNAETGEVAQRLDYDSWGVVTGDTSPGLQPFGYAGGLYDPDTKLVRFGARDYDATTGAWLSPEPLSQSPGYVVSEALRGFATPAYAYAANNPISYIDPDGLATYRCRKPLDALGGKDAPRNDQRNGPDVKGNPLFHEYLCVFRNGKMTCGGLTQRDDKPFGPGKPSDDVFIPERCELINEENWCLERCVLNAFESKRPPYSVIPGTGGAQNCQEWAEDRLGTCMRACKDYLAGAPPPG